MKVGFVGAGKLGKVVAVAVDSLGHEVICFDVDPSVMQKDSHPYIEAGKPLAATFEQALRASGLKFWPLDDLVAESDVILVAVPTPHQDEFDGTHPLPDARVDFDYRYVKEALDGICAEVIAQKRERPLGVIVVSTMLPGTLRRIVGTLTSPPAIHYIYSPQYIAMGTTLEDYLDPEFIMVGYLDPPNDRSSRALICRHLVHELYEPLQLDCLKRTGRRPPLLEMSAESAEIGKVAYNCAISTRLAVINSLMELCHRLPGAHIDDVSRVLMAAYRRVSGNQYWRGQMGDGGSCHPRDGIAMSWLAREKELGFDVFEAAMLAREKHAQWFASIIAENVTALALGLERRTNVLIFGYGYKPGSNITAGSHALLLWRMLTDDPALTNLMTVDLRDPIVEGKTHDPTLFFDYDLVFLGQNHPLGDRAYDFPQGITVIDPFRIVRPQAGVRLISLGIGPDHG